jgi:hypothetical protein
MQSQKQKSQQTKSGEWSVDDGSHVGGQKLPDQKTVCCSEATASSFVTKVQGEVFAHFHAFTIKHHSSMQN